jgi:hypothetical protein
MIGEDLQLSEALKKFSGELHRLPREKIRTPHIAYEKCISTEDGRGFCSTALVRHHIGDVLRRVPGCIKNPDIHILDLKFVPFLNGPMRKGALAYLGGDDFCTRPCGQVHVARNKVCMKMGFENMSNSHSHSLCHPNIFLNISLWVDDSTRPFPSEKVRKMGEAWYEKGLNKHESPPPFFSLNSGISVKQNFNKMSSAKQPFLFEKSEKASWSHVIYSIPF